MHHRRRQGCGSRGNTSGHDHQNAVLAQYTIASAKMVQNLCGQPRKMAHCVVDQCQYQSPRFGPEARSWKAACAGERVTQDLNQWVGAENIGGKA